MPLVMALSSHSVSRNEKLALPSIINGSTQRHNIFHNVIEIAFAVYVARADIVPLAHTHTHPFSLSLSLPLIIYLYQSIQVYVSTTFE